MAYQFVQNGNVEYAVHWETIEQLNRSFHVAAETLRLANRTVLSQSTWSNPFSWKMPDIINVEVDWDAVKQNAAMANMKDMMEFGRVGATSMASVGHEMLSRIQRTQFAKSAFQDYVKAAGLATAKNIDAAVDSYEGLAEGARFVRDTSADIVVVGASVATGGLAAGGLLAGGSALKGIGRYQDTGSIGQGLAQFTGSMALGAFKIRPALGLSKIGLGTEYTLILVQGGFETALTYASGTSFTESLKKGAIKIAGDAGAKALFGLGPIKRVFEKMPIPGVFAYNSSGEASNVSNALAGKVTEKVSAKVGPKAVGSLIGSSGRSGAASASQDDSLVRDAVIYNEVLLKFAICRMDRGIGHGW